MRCPLSPIGAVMIFAATAALATALGDNDYRVLAKDFGLGRDDRILGDMTAEEQSELHRILNDPAFADAPLSRSSNTADYLYRVHIRECQSWRESSNRSGSCPSSGNPIVDRGQDVAERQCNYCHLFGTPSAPSFHKLAARGMTEPELAGALAQGHRMSPITLEPADTKALLAYIISKK